MKSHSIDNIHNQLDKHILLTQSYTEINELFFIIKACRLKPYSYLFEKKSNKLILHRQWIDEFGNTFNITDKKRIEIVQNDLSLNRNRIICTDLYYGLSLDKIVKISKLAYLCLGKDEDLYQDCYTITFLGIDNYLRSYQYCYGVWQQVSPLLLGIKNLRIIGKNSDLRYFKNFSNKENVIIPCINAEQWLTYLPASKEFLLLMKNQHELIYNLLRTTKE